MKRDHFTRKVHLPTINFQGICKFSGGVVHIATLKKVQRQYFPSGDEPLWKTNTDSNQKVTKNANPIKKYQVLLLDFAPATFHPSLRP